MIRVKVALFVTAMVALLLSTFAIPAPVSAQLCENGDRPPSADLNLPESDRLESAEVYCSQQGRGGVANSADDPGFDLDLKEFSAAVEVDDRPCDDGEYSDSVLGIPVWYRYLDVRKDVFIFEDGSEVDGKCTPRIQRDSDGNLEASSVLPIGLALLEALMSLAGIVAVVMVIWGGFQFVLTQGEPDKAAGARKTVINAAVGLVIVIVATRVVAFIAERITSA